MKEQAHSVFSQLKKAMEAAGGSLADVAQLQMFIIEARKNCYAPICALRLLLRLAWVRLRAAIKAL